MTTELITGRGTIRTGHPVKWDFSQCSSGNDSDSYYETKGHAIRAFESALAKYGLQFDPNDCMDMPGDEGRMMVEVWTDKLECSSCVGRALLMWYRMDYSGRWEVIGYLP